MKNTIKKAVSAVLAAAMCLSLYSTMPKLSTSALELGTYEAEELECTDPTVWTSVYDKQIGGEYSGEGFIYLTNCTLKMEIEVEEEGMYSISARCAQILSEDGRMQTISVNGVDYTYNLPYLTDWTDVNFGVFRFKEGVNVIEIKPQYGYACYDTITVGEAVLPELTGDSVPCDSQATDETRALMQYLSSVYGNNILSGQQEIYGGGHSMTTTIRYDAATDTCVDSDGNTYTFDESSKDTADDGSTFVWTCYDENGQAYNYNSQNRNYTYNYYDYEVDYLYNLTGEYPAIRGFDFGSYCPCYAWDDGVTDRMIDWANNKGGIVTASWHINVPTSMSTYTLGEPLDFSLTTYNEKTDFVTANVMVEGTVEYEYFKLCMENLANELLKLQDAGVPVIFRPFHEAEGNGGLDGSGAWFWWAKEGSEVYKELWIYLYDTLTEEYGLHNLIWEENLYAWSSDSALWYVGDDYVDIVGYDKYNTQYHRHDGNTSGPNEDAESKIFYSLVDYVNNSKMVSMPENDTVPSLENLLIEKAGWLYFCPWYDSDGSEFVSGSQYQNADTLTELYQSEYCITLSELPDDLYVWKGSTEVTEPTDTTDGDDILYGDVNDDGSISILDVIAINKSLMGSHTLTSAGKAAADVDQDGVLTAADSLSIMKYCVKLIGELPITA